jgi:hypothetical protein
LLLLCSQLNTFLSAICSYLSDLVEINTRTCVVRSLSPSGAPPQPRAYHALAPLRGCLLVLGGRAAGSRLVKGRAVMAAWDAGANKWVSPGGCMRQA